MVRVLAEFILSRDIQGTGNVLHNYYILELALPKGLPTVSSIIYVTLT